MSDEPGNSPVIVNQPGHSKHVVKSTKDKTVKTKATETSVKATDTAEQSDTVTETENPNNTEDSQSVHTPTEEDQSVDSEISFTVPEGAYAMLEQEQNLTPNPGSPSLNTNGPPGQATKTTLETQTDDMQHVIKGIHNKVDDIKRSVQYNLDLMTAAQTDLQHNMNANIQGSLANVAKASHALNLSPSIYSGSKFEPVDQFVTQFQRYNLLCKYNDTEALTMLTCFLRGPALNWYTEKYPDVHLKSGITLESVLASLKAKFCTGRLNFIEQEQLLDRKQLPDEGFEVFFSDLKRRFALCNISEAEKFKIFYKALLPRYQRPLLERDITKVNEAAEVIKKEIQINSMAGDPNGEIQQKLDALQSAVQSFMQPKVKSMKQVATVSSKQNPEPNTGKLKTSEPRKPPSPCKYCSGSHWHNECPKNQQKRSNFSNRSRVTCEFCHKIGHSINQCYQKQNAQKNNQFQEACTFCGLYNHSYANCRRRAQQPSSQQSKRCFYCQSFSHLIANCALRHAHLAAGHPAPQESQVSTITNPPTSPRH
jgi:hypothetical protein